MDYIIEKEIEEDEEETPRSKAYGPKPSSPRREYQAEYHAEHPRQAIHRVECQRARERLAKFWATRHIVYKSPLPPHIDPDSREYQEAEKEIRSQIETGQF